jgi:hypothetical protein
LEAPKSDLAAFKTGPLTTSQPLEALDRVQMLRKAVDMTPEDFDLTFSLPDMPPEGVDSISWSPAIPRELLDSTSWPPDMPREFLDSTS